MATEMGEYGVEVQNRFNLVIDDDQDLYELLKNQEDGKGKTKKDEKQSVKSGSKTDRPSTSATAKKPISKPSASQSIENVKTQQNGGRTTDSAARNSNDQRPARVPKPRGDKAVSFPEESRPTEERQPRRQPDDGGIGNEGRGSRGGRGVNRGSARGAVRGSFARPEKREYDRHSGSDRTGIKAVDKKEGGGSHNWGTVDDDLPEPAAPVEVPEAAQPEDVENQDPNVEQPAVPQGDVEPQEMTLDEYKAQQDKLRVKSEFNIRKPNEGVDNKQWKGTFVLTKPKEPEATEGDSAEEESEEEVEDTNKVLSQQLLHKFTFNDSDRGSGSKRRGRGGRGGDRAYSGRLEHTSDRDTNAERPSYRDRPSFDDRSRSGFGERSNFGSPSAKQGFGQPGQGSHDDNKSGSGNENSNFSRGGYRGRAGFGSSRGGDRGRGTPRKEPSAPRVDDENDFPTLGKH